MSLSFFISVGEYAERGQNTRIRFRVGLLCEYVNLEYVRVHVSYWTNQAECAIRIPVAAPQEYVLSRLPYGVA